MLSQERARYLLGALKRLSKSQDDNTGLGGPEKVTPGRMGPLFSHSSLCFPVSLQPESKEQGHKDRLLGVRRQLKSIILDTSCRSGNMKDQGNRSPLSLDLFSIL